MSFLLAILWVIFAALLCWQLLRWLPAGADKYNPLPYIIALLPLATYVVGALLFFSILATEWQVLYASKNPQSYNFAKSYAYLCIAYAVLFLISLKSYASYWFGRFRSAQLHLPENSRQMFHINAETATNSGEKTPGNVPQNHQNSYICRKIPGKCSTKQPQQLHSPENSRQMFHINAETATFSGEKTPGNVPQNHQNSYICRKIPGKCSKKQPKEIRVMTLNCRYGKANASQIIETAKKYNVNTLLLQELSESLVKNLEKLGICEIFPTFCVGAKSEHNNGGFNAIFTQYSAISTCNNSVKIEAASVPSVTTRLDFDKLDFYASANVFVKFASAHPKSPMRGCKAWSEGIRALANLIENAETCETAETYATAKTTATAENPKSSESATLTILTGDLNSTIDHPSFRTLIKAGFADSAISLRYRLRTWPTWLKWPNLTLDHVLFCAKNCRAKAVRQQNVEIDGTDHLAYIAAIALYPTYSPTFSPIHSID